MIKNFLASLFHRILQRIPYVQKLEADLTSALIGGINIVSMNMKNGKLHIAFKTNVTEALADFGNSTHEEADAKNYVEISFGFAPDRAVGSILIRKHDGKPPHELRIIAEAERDQAIAALKIAEAQRDKAIAALKVAEAQRDQAIAEKEQLETEILGIELEDTEVPRGK